MDNHPILQELRQVQDKRVRAGLVDKYDRPNLPPSALWFGLLSQERSLIKRFQREVVRCACTTPDRESCPGAIARSPLAPTQRTEGWCTCQCHPQCRSH